MRIKRSSLTSDIVMVLEEWVLKQAAPGERITESNLMQELGTSQTPVREALRVLEGRGYVRHDVSRRRTFVAQFSRNDIANLDEVRSLLEQRAWLDARQHGKPSDFAALADSLDLIAAVEDSRDVLAYHRAHREFHLASWRASRNPWLVETLDRVCTPIWIHYAQLSRNAAPRRFSGAAAHRPILEFIAGKAVVPDEASYAAWLWEQHKGRVGDGLMEEMLAEPHDHGAGLGDADGDE